MSSEEKLPLIESRNRKREEQPRPRKLYIWLSIVVIICQVCATFQVGCRLATGFWPAQYFDLSPAQRILHKNPLIGMYKLCGSAKRINNGCNENRLSVFTDCLFFCG